MSIYWMRNRGQCIRTAVSMIRPPWPRPRGAVPALPHGDGRRDHRQRPPDRGRPAIWGVAMVDDRCLAGPRYGARTNGTEASRGAAAAVVEVYRHYFDAAGAVTAPCLTTSDPRSRPSGAAPSTRAGVRRFYSLMIERISGDRVPGAQLGSSQSARFGFSHSLGRDRPRCGEPTPHTLA